jgi:predicted alternative tryptophan synthase beta-subunit
MLFAKEPYERDPSNTCLTKTGCRNIWYNLVADLPKPPPPVLHPGTLQAISPDDLAPLFPMTLIQQEVATERDIEIPEPVRDDLPAMAAQSSVPCSPARKGSGYPSTDLL